MNGAGRLRHRLVHETSVELPDGQGGVTRSFVIVDALWGALTTRAVSELMADRSGAALSHEVTLRAPATVKPGDRLRLGERVLAVDTVSDPDGRGRYIACRCREETP